MQKFIQSSDLSKTNKASRKTREFWLSRILPLARRSKLDQDVWDELEEILITADVGIDTTEKLIKSVRGSVDVQNADSVNDVLSILKTEIMKFLPSISADEPLISDTPPSVILMIGVNGAGKTTSIAKLAYMFKNAGKTVLLGAADTFRAAAIDQLEVWGKRLSIDVIAHQPGSDPGAVAFDTVSAARTRNIDVVIIDTAGRLHTQQNLMEELKKIQRVVAGLCGNSQKVMLTLDATTGQNGLIQARKFTDSLACHAVFLAKLDGSSKGGIILPISVDLSLPVLYIGTGECVEDSARFNPQEFVEGLF